MDNVFILPAIIVCSALLLLLQVFLSFRKNKWLGIIPSVVLIIMALTVSAYSVHTLNSYTIETLEAEMASGYEMRMYIRYDKNGDMIDYSNVSVFDKDGNLLDSIHVDVDKQGNIIENEYSMVYIKDVKTLLGDRKLKGYPDLDIETEKMVRMNDGGYFSPWSFLFIAIYPCLVLLLIHIVIRIAIKKKRQKKELEKLKIESL